MFKNPHFSQGLWGGGGGGNAFLQSKKFLFLVQFANVANGGLLLKAYIRHNKKKFYNEGP